MASTRAKDELYLSYPLVAAPRDRERVVMKASRFLEELPAEPDLFERWQLDAPAGAVPALAPVPALAALPARDPRVVPALFGAPTSTDESEDGGEDVPF